MKNNINEKNNKLCTSCGVCSVVCPEGCIVMKRSSEGFYIPEVDEDLCIGCGFCQKVCSKYYNDDGGSYIEEVIGYLAYSKNTEIRENASSGGLGKELTVNAIKNGFEVCGAEYNYKKENVQHIIIDNIEELDRIVGSKYIPSYTNEGFNKLDRNKKYLIIGTPCQIYGLRKLKDMKKLSKDVILIDFFCHGTPSLNLWDKYLEIVKEKLGTNNIEKVNFRDKKYGWHNFSMYFKGDNREYRVQVKEDIFLNIFLENVDLNLPCYNCKFRFNKIYSDIRLADFWGGKCKDDEFGTSLVLSNTNKGEEWLSELDTVYLEKVSFLDIKDSQYCKEIRIPKERDYVQKELMNNSSIYEIYSKYVIPIKRRKKRKEILIYPYRKFKALFRRCKQCIKIKE